MSRNEVLSQNMDIILSVLKRNNNSMTFLALKKESKLANLYFFQALELLKIEKIVFEDNRSDTIFITLNE